MAWECTLFLFWYVLAFFCFCYRNFLRGTPTLWRLLHVLIFSLGFFLLLNGSRSSAEGKAVISVPVAKANSEICVGFWYYMLGPSVSTLDLSVQMVSAWFSWLLSDLVILLIEILNALLWFVVGNLQTVGLDSKGDTESRVDERTSYHQWEWCHAGKVLNESTICSCSGNWSALFYIL